MKLADAIAKKLMYTFNSSVKLRHLGAFIRYSSFRKVANLLRVEAGIFRGKTRDFGLPYMLTVEPTNRCNLRCPLCPTGKRLPGRDWQNMDVEAFRRIMDEVGDYVYMINFQNWGEPLLARELPELIAIARRKRVATTVATNGNYPLKLNQRIVESGLDNIVVAVDGATQETYEQYRVNGKLDVVTNNIKQLVKLREAAGLRRPFVEFQFLVFDHNRQDIPAIKRLAKELGADGLIIRAAVAPGNNENRRKFYTWNEERNFCRRFWYTASINADLGVTPCCNFFFKRDDLGNLSTQSFQSTWNGDVYAQNRLAVATRNYDQLHDNCKACKKYHGHLGCEAYGVAEDRGPEATALHDIEIA